MAKQLIAWLLLCSVTAATAADNNFKVTGVANPDQTAKWADQLAEQQSQEWFGKPFPKLTTPVPIRVNQIPGRGDSGVTTGTLDSDGRVRGLGIELTGDVTAISRRALPHEIMHVVMLVQYESRMGTQADKWLSEGVATLLEDDWDSQKFRLETALRQGRGIPVRVILETNEYLADQNLQYLQSASITRFLLHHDTFNRLLNFGRDIKRQNTSKALEAHYGYENIHVFAAAWNEWVAAGSPSPKARFGNGCVMRFLKRWVPCTRPRVSASVSYASGGT